MSGACEQGICTICGNTAIVDRTYYYYNVRCDCCVGNQHFEIVYTCNQCKPEKPRKIKALVTNVPRGVPKVDKNNVQNIRDILVLFRKWTTLWEKYDKDPSKTAKPMNSDEFLKEINSRYNVTEKADSNYVDEAESRSNLKTIILGNKRGVTKTLNIKPNTTYKEVITEIRKFTPNPPAEFIEGIKKSFGVGTPNRKAKLKRNRSKDTDLEFTITGTTDE